MPTFSIYTSHIYCIYEVILELIHNAVLRLITITIYLTACLRVACMRVRVCAVAWHTLLLLVHCAITVDATIILAFSSCSAFDANGRSIEFCRDRGFKFCIFFFTRKKVQFRWPSAVWYTEEQRCELVVRQSFLERATGIIWVLWTHAP